MKGFYITVSNGLLETKHFEQMGQAVWLFMWFLDHMTSVSEEGIGLVLGGKPITHEDVSKDMKIPQRTFVRYLSILKKNNYILTVRTPHGLSIKVNKAQKIFKQKSDTPEMAYHNSDAPKMSERCAKNGACKRCAKNGACIYRQDSLDKTIDKTTLSKDNGKPMYGNNDINQVSAYFLRRMGIPKEDCTQKQSRQYWYLLLKESKKGVVGVLWLIDRAKEDSWYAKNITSSKDLYYKRIKILQRKASHIEKFAVMKGGENNGQEKLEIEDSRGNSLPDNATEGVLPTSN